MDDREGRPDGNQGDRNHPGSVVAGKLGIRDETLTAVDHETLKAFLAKLVPERPPVNTGVVFSSTTALTSHQRRLEGSIGTITIENVSPSVTVSVFVGDRGENPVGNADFKVAPFCWKRFPLTDGTEAICVIVVPQDTQQSQINFSLDSRQHPYATGGVSA